MVLLPDVDHRILYIYWISGHCGLYYCCFNSDLHNPVPSIQKKSPAIQKKNIIHKIMSENEYYMLQSTKDKYYIFSLGLVRAF